MFAVYSVGLLGDGVEHPHAGGALAVAVVQDFGHDRRTS